METPAKIIGAAAVESPSRRYYAWQAEKDAFILYVEDTATKARYSVQCTYEQFYEMREWSDRQWDEWLVIALRGWLNR